MNSDPIKKIGPNQFQITKGGGCISLFGLLFFGAGIFLLLIATGLFPVQNASDVPWYGRLFILVMAVVFIAVGGGLTFGREWIVIDKGRGRIEKSQGLLLPIRHEELSLSDYRSVAVRFQAGDSDSGDSYPVVLAAKNGKDLALDSSSQYSDSHNRAAYIARLLKLPLEDASTGHTNIRQPEELGVSFQARLAASIEQDQHVSRPMQMRSEISTMNGATQITIPGARTNPLTFLAALIPAGLFFICVDMAVPFLFDTDSGLQFPLKFLLLFLIVLFAIFATSLWRWLGRANRKTIVSINRTGIVLDEAVGWWRRRTEISVKQIIDIDYGIAQGAWDSVVQQTMQQLPANKQAEAQAAMSSAQVRVVRAIANSMARSKGIIVKSEQGITTFGAGLPDDEVRYLYWVVKQALAPL